MGLTAHQVFAATGGSAGADNSLGLQLSAGAVALLVGSPLPGRGAGLPLVDDWACLHAMVDEWQRSCGGGAPMDQYAMRHTRFLANLCNAGLGAEDLRGALAGSGCAAAPDDGGVHSVRLAES